LLPLQRQRFPWRRLLRHEVLQLPQATVQLVPQIEPASGTNKTRKPMLSVRGAGVGEVQSSQQPPSTRPPHQNFVEPNVGFGLLLKLFTGPSRSCSSELQTGCDLRTAACSDAAAFSCRGCRTSSHLLFPSVPRPHPFPRGFGRCRRSSMQLYHGAPALSLHVPPTHLTHGPTKFATSTRIIRRVCPNHWGILICFQDDVCICTFQTFSQHPSAR
jgi:hypothetical protein